MVAAIQRDDEAELTEPIYDAAFDPAILDDVIARLRARLDASISILFVYDATGPVPWHFHGFEAQVFEAYNGHYHHDDIYRHGLIAHGLLRSNDFGSVYGSPLHVARDGAFVELSFYRPVASEPFMAADLDFLNRMAPHLGRAARLRLRLERQARPPSWTFELLDALPWGVILLDGRQRPVVVNRAAERILDQADGLRLDRRGLFADHLDESQRLRGALDQATASCNGHAGAGADLQLTRPSGAPALLVTVVPLGRRVLDQLGTCSLRAAVHIVDPAHRPVAAAERLRTFFNLTPAEAALAQALAAGKTLQEHAQEARLTCETARWRLKQVLAKTDTHRQAELVRLLLSSAVLG